MNKLFKILLWFFVLTIVYIWFSMAFKSCGNKAENLGEELVETSGELVDGVEETIGEVSEEFFESEDMDDTSGDDGSFESPQEQETVQEEIIEEEIIEDTPPPKYTQSTSSNSGGQYMLIAGNYLVASNAGEMTKKLKNLGYSNAEKAIFEDSPYHTVIAARYSDYGEAIRASSNLKAQGIECYVKKRT